MIFKVMGGALYQWDTGRYLEISPRENHKVDEVHFKNPHGDTAYVITPKEVDGKLTAPIPNILLQETTLLRAYATMYTAEGEQTIFDNTFGIIPRQKPSDYVYTETEVYNIESAVKKAIEEAFANQKAKAKIGEIKAQTEALAKNQNALADRVEQLESLSLVHFEDEQKSGEGLLAYEQKYDMKIVPDGVGKLALIKSIGGNTERKKEVLGKNLIDPKEIASRIDGFSSDYFSYVLNVDGSITYTTNPGEVGLFDIDFGINIESFPRGTYYLYIEGVKSWWYNGIDIRINLGTDFDESIGEYDDYGETTRTLKVMLWRDESITTDTWEVVEAPEGTVFEQYVGERFYLADTAVERVESLGADETTLIDTVTMPEAVKALDGYGIGCYPYYNTIDWVDDKVSVIKRVKKIILNGSEAWYENAGQSGNPKYFYSPELLAEHPFIPHTLVCDLYSQTSVSVANKNIGINTGTVGGRANTVVVRPENADNMSVADFKAQLAENPITLVYALATPEVEDITELFTEDNTIKVESCGRLRFVNEHKQYVPNTIGYVTRKE